ncbi:hypothetical protein J3F84DRAFT_215356 [Trichoderma pleuroticola]
MGFVKAFWRTLGSLSPLVSGVSSFSSGLSRAYQYPFVRLFSLAMLRSISFLATRPSSPLTLPFFPFFPLTSLARLLSVSSPSNFLTCISSPLEMHTRLPPPSPPLHYPLGPFRGNCGLGCFINRAVRVGFARGGCDSMAGNATVFFLCFFSLLFQPWSHEGTRTRYKARGAQPCRHGIRLGAALVLHTWSVRRPRAWAHAMCG